LPSAAPESVSLEAKPASGSKAEKPEGAAKVVGEDRPKKVDATCTEERRARLEEAYPEAKGFLVAKDLESKLIAQKISHGTPATKAFDELARDQWVLFHGPLNALSRDSFELPLIFAPKSKKDPFGMSSMWLQIEFRDVVAYNSVTLEEGQDSVVLAKYNGNKQASPGYDLVALGIW
jgi:hypothetical protein